MSKTNGSLNALMQRTPRESGAVSSSTKMSASNNFTKCQVELRETSKNEKLRQLEAERRQDAAEGRETAAMRLVEENTQLIKQCQATENDALAHTQAKLKERLHENQGMRKALDGELRDMDAAIDRIKKMMSETAHQMKSLDEPTENASTCASWRNQRSIVEHIADPVSTRFQAQRATIFQAQQQLVGHHMDEKSHLRDLKDRRSRLKEDLKEKTVALEIDSACLQRQASAHPPGAMVGSPRAPQKQRTVFTPVNYQKRTPRGAPGQLSGSGPFNAPISFPLAVQ